jgi:hypothetical protein
LPRSECTRDTADASAGSVPSPVVVVVVVVAFVVVVVFVMRHTMSDRCAISSNPERSAMEYDVAASDSRFEWK